MESAWSAQVLCLSMSSLAAFGEEQAGFGVGLWHFGDS